MSIFQYKAIDINGKENNGVIENDSLKSARSLLQSQNLTIIEIAKIQQKVAQTNSWMVASIKLIDISLIIQNSFFQMLYNYPGPVFTKVV